MKYVIMVVVMLQQLTAMAEIREAPSLDVIYQELEQSGEETLVLLDVGGTLLVRSDPVLHLNHKPWVEAWFESNASHLSSEETLFLIRVVEESVNSWDLVDEWPDLIKKSAERKVKIAAFTKVLDLSFRDIRGRQLAHFGLDLQDVLPELKAGGDLFTYADGVIQTGEKLKGPVLKEIVQKLSLRPSKIIFVDDQRRQVESVNQACEEEGIVCIGFHYTPFNETPVFDESMAEEQFHILLNEHRWVSSKEIKE